MISSALRHSAEKAVWGRTILGVVFACLMLSATPAEAASKGASKGPSVSAADSKKAVLDARKARRHPKLDQQLNDAVEDKANGQSDVIIQFHDDSDGANLVRAHGGKPGRKFDALKARVGRMSNSKLKALANDPRVKSIHFDRPTQSFATREAVTVGALAVRELMGYTGAGVGVAIVDSGVTEWHDDLTFANGQGQRVAHFADFVNGYTQPYDDFGHGTHVAGIVAGNGYDMNGVRSAIAPEAHIISLKALDGEGHGTISMIIAAIDYAVANKDALNIRVLNLSLGAAVTESYNTDPLTLAAKRAVDAGIVVVASAGNLGKARNGQPQYGAIGSPGNAPWVITVGASSHNGTVLRQDDTMAPFSSRGPTMFDYAAKPDLVAPGYGVVSLSDPVSRFYATKSEFLVGGFVNTSYTPYLTLSGTSMAAPVVSGTVALMLQANPSLTPNLVKAILQFTSQEYPGYDALTQGTGFLNARGAVVLAEYFRRAEPGSAYPSMNGWSRQIFWGNKRVRGGVLTPFGTAWGGDVQWGTTTTPAGANVVWGDNCADTSCDGVVWGTNIVWGNTDATNIVWGNNNDDNIVWGNSDLGNIVWGNNEADNIVWGNSEDDNIVWGNDCGGADCDNIVWGNSGADNIVWGNAENADNIVWGNNDYDNIVWGNSDDDNIVWGNSDLGNIVWGNSAPDPLLNNLTQPLVGDETNEVNSLPSSMWDAMFPLDAQWPAPPADAPSDAVPVTETAPPAEETAPPPAVEETAPATDNTEALPPPTTTTTTTTTSGTSLLGVGGLY